MPIYEYRCADCDRSFETFVRPGRDQAQCPSCHGVRLVREMSVFAAASSAPSSGAEACAAAGAPSNGGCCGGSCGCR